MTDAGTGPELPPKVRARLIALTARAIDAIPAAQLPAELRAGAAFTQARRAKLLGARLIEAVSSDEDFRDRLAVQLRLLDPRAVDLLESSEPAAGADLPDAAAAAFVLRPDGWERVLDAARAAEAGDAAAGDDARATIDRLTTALDRAKHDVRVQRERHRSQLESLKSDNAQLRRTLGQTRAELRAAHEAAATVQEEAKREGDTAAAASRALEAELRRVKARVSELESGHASARRAQRDDRDSEVMRLRLLLDTVMDAAAGLRRELALPPSDALPADTVAAIEPAAGSSVVGASRSLPDDDPTLLRRLLELPRVHLIIDGYNVSKSAWPDAPLERQRRKLVTGVSGLVAGQQIETTIVFDGADLAQPPAVSSPRGIRVRFSPPGVIADDLIRQLVEAEPTGRAIVVVSTDREVATTVTKKGARAVASQALIRAIAS